MLVFVFLIALAVPTFAQDENSEDAFAMPQNEGMEGFVMSTAMLEPVGVTTKTLPAVERVPGVLDEAMAEDPFEMKDSQFTSVSATDATTPTVPAVAPTVSEAEGKATETSEDEGKATTELSKEEEQPIPSTATVWTASTEVARETTERRVLKEKSGEVKENQEKKEEATTVKMEETTTAKTNEDSEETPFDSHQLSGLFEADGSPKVEGGPEFPILQLPEEHSAEILGNEDPRSSGVDVKDSTSETTSTTTISTLAPMLEEATTTEATTAGTTMEETTMTTTTTGMMEEQATDSTTTATTTKMEETTKTPTTVKAEETTTTISTTTMAPLMREEAAHRPLSPNILTPITVKITSIEWMNDFANVTSGKYKKLVEQILPELNQHLRDVFEDDFISFDIESLSKGSVVVNGFVSLKTPVSDAEGAASRFEALLSAAGSRLGGNTVDPTSVTVNGAPSRAYLDRVNASYSPASASPLLIAAVVGVAVVLFIVLITCICLATNRRSQGGVKLGMKRPEDGNVRMGGVPQINLMSYAGSSAVSPSSRSTMPRQEEREVV